MTTVKYASWETMAQDIKDGNIESLESLIDVKRNPSYSEYKYSAWLGPWSCDIDGNDPEQVKRAAVDLLDVIVNQLMDADNNYGLAFYACGYDGQAQTDFIKYYADEYGVEVF